MSMTLIQCPFPAAHTHMACCEDLKANRAIVSTFGCLLADSSQVYALVYDLLGFVKFQDA